MLDKAFYTYVLGKFNANTQNVVFKGNYVFVRINDTMTLMEASAYNAYDQTLKSYVAMAETISTETPFVESNNRSGWTKQFAFMFPMSQKDTVLAALQEVRDTFFATATHTITDGTDSYKYVIKCQRPSFASASAPQAGEVYLTYTMQLYADSVETGYYGDEATHTMKISTDGTYTTLNYDSITVSSAVNMDASAILDSEVNTTHSPTTRAVSVSMALNYDSSTLLESLLGQIDGTTSRTVEYDYRKVFDGVTKNFTLGYAKGSKVYKRGVLSQLNLEFVEV